MTHRPNKLHLGCGLVTPEGWLNVDGSLNARLARLGPFRRILSALQLIPRTAADIAWSGKVTHHDVRKRLPWPDASFTHVYASHLLEHLYLTEAQALLRECHRVLAPGGVIRIVVPDLRALIEDYVAQRPDPSPQPSPGCTTPADVLNSRLGFHLADPPGGGFLMRWYHATRNFHVHKWMYDADSLVNWMSRAGFERVARRNCMQSDIPDIRSIETEERVVAGGLAVEGVKPGR